MAIDYGGKRIGVAVSDSGLVAMPHSIVRNEGDVVGKLASLAGELGADTIVLGVPRRSLSNAGERKFEELAEHLGRKTGKTVVLWDETLTTAEASDRLRAAGRSRRDAQREVDMHAAAVILQSYLDRRRS